MTHRLECYVRPYRRRWGLTQRELALLVGVKSGTVVSRIERQERQPTLAFVIGCEIVFGTPPEELFPGLFKTIEKDVLSRAYDLYLDLQGGRSAATSTKLDLLEEALARSKRIATNDV